MIVHRESEEYVTDYDEAEGPKMSQKSKTFVNFWRLIPELFPLSLGDSKPSNVDHDLILPVVTICVDSPKDEEQKSIAQTPDIEQVILERSTMATESSNVVNINEPIDINLANTCDTSKVIYDY